MPEHDPAKLGYSKEEEYFFKKNKELIERRRRELDAQRTQEAAERKKQAFWMRCPKCGGRLEEIELRGIKLDRCPSCGGTFFDKGEMELFLETSQGSGFLGGLKKLFR